MENEKITKDQLIELINETHGDESMDWYMDRSGWERKRISGIRLKLGYEKKKSWVHSRVDVVNRMVDYGLQIKHEDLDGLTGLSKARAAMRFVRDKFPGEKQYHYRLTQEALAKHWKPKVKAKVKPIVALRLPLSGIAEVFQ